jgi:hypothetical protein
MLLLVLNLGYFAWGQGWLLAYGWGPAQQQEPQRLVQQIHPEALQVLGGKDAAPEPTPPAAAASATEAGMGEATSASACWQLNDLDPAQAEALRPVLSSRFAAGAWALDEVGLAPRWMVYMGKFPNALELAKKREQLISLKLKFSPVTGAAWSPGLSLGVFSSQEGANTALQELLQRGVRSAKVVQERPSSLSYHLRLPAVTPAEQPALDAVKQAVPGKPLESCPAAAPG